jgi:hypothetical protein
MEAPVHETLKSRVGWLWILAFLFLPNCVLQRGGLGPELHFNPGAQPHSSAVFCDIESNSLARHCASPDEIAIGVPLASAAVALTKGIQSNIGLDYSPVSISALGCSPGQPVAVTFRGPFPDGAAACLNCAGVIGPVYADANAACVDRCKDMTEGGDVFCDPTHAHISTNAGTCVDGACTPEGALRADFEDPRRIPEPVTWTDAVGVGTSGPDANTLTRTDATTGQFDAGAASTQTITQGDGYVEFTATETDKARICGLSTGAPPDLDPSRLDIGFAIRLSNTGGVFVAEGGTVVTGPDPDGSFGTYAAGDRLRVSVTDQFDGTAAVTYLLIPAACSGPDCDGMVLRTTTGAAYPLRVDTSMREQGATLTDVRIVRIK